MKTMLLLCILALLLSACEMNPPLPVEPAFAAVKPVVAVPPPIRNGSLYQTGYGMSLFSDVSAKRVGDVITIVIQENTNASKRASTSTSKASSASLPSPTLFGEALKLGGKELFNAALENESEFEGSGDSSQSNTFNSRLSVTVAEVLPNGYLVVQGEKRLTLNQGSEFVRFSGIVRPADIRSDNSVDSSTVANAQIIYGGKGVLADANTQGWLSRVFNSAWWPF